MALGFAASIDLAASTEVGAIAPPPVPKAWTEASSNISRIAPALIGDWSADDPARGWQTELRIGRFGNSANPYLLIGRVVHIPQGQSGALGEIQVYGLSVLTYLSPCHAFAMLSLDQLAHEGTGIDCATAFPIDVRSDGSPAFSYMDGPNRIDVTVDGKAWRETTNYPSHLHLQPRKLELQKSDEAVSWGVTKQDRRQRQPLSSGH
jgi:hypothetical protein